MSNTNSSATNNTASSMNNTNPTDSATSSTPELNAEELKKELEVLEDQLRKSHALKGKDKPRARTADDDITRRKKFARAHDKILYNMLRIMDTCKTRGFVYGIVTESGKTVTGASDSLRAWWKEKVRFDVNSPAAIDQFYRDNSLPLRFQRNEEQKSTFEMLMELSDMIMGSVLSTLMQHCDPPQRKFPLEKGIPPPWWPNGNEAWLDEAGIPIDQRTPPFRKPHDLKKAWKVCVLIAVIKNISPDFYTLSRLGELSKTLKERMRAKEIKVWGMVINQESDMQMRDHPHMPRPILPPAFHNQGGRINPNNVLNSSGQNTINTNVQNNITPRMQQLNQPLAPFAPPNLYPIPQLWSHIHQNYNFGTIGAPSSVMANSSLNYPLVAPPPIEASLGIPLMQMHPHGVNNRGEENDGNPAPHDGNPRGGNAPWFF